MQLRNDYATPWSDISAHVGYNNKFFITERSHLIQILCKYLCIQEKNKAPAVRVSEGF